MKPKDNAGAVVAAALWTGLAGAVAVAILIEMLNAAGLLPPTSDPPSQLRRLFGLLIFSAIVITRPWVLWSVDKRAAIELATTIALAATFVAVVLPVYVAGFGIVWQVVGWIAGQVISVRVAFAVEAALERRLPEKERPL